MFKGFGWMTENELTWAQYYARMLEKNTPKLKPKPARDAELFSFAKKRGWAEKLDPKDIELMRGIIADYNEALRRIRVSRIKIKQMTRCGDIERILFSPAQEEEYRTDELYGVFQESSAEEIHDICTALDRENRHLLDEDGREDFLLHYLPYNRHEYIDLFADFRSFGFRILSDIIADLDDMYVAEERKKNAVRTDTDSKLVNDIMKHYLKGRSKDYRANKQEDTDCVILPVDSFNAYFGTTCFDRKRLPEFPEEIIKHDDYAGLCRFRMSICFSNENTQGAKPC